MFKVAKNRLHELVSTFKGFGSPVSRKQALRKYASFAGKRLATLFLNVTPDGSKWTEPNYQSYTTGRQIIHGRPSQRQYGTTLYKSWGATEINDTYRGVSFVLGTKTRQMEYLLKGAPEHPIPRSGRITFHHIATGVDMFFGGRGEKGFINHPGFQRLTALEQSYRRHGKGLVKADFNRARRSIWSPIASFWGHKQSF